LSLERRFCLWLSAGGAGFAAGLRRANRVTTTLREDGDVTQAGALVEPEH
jgi:hypothetical protein